MFFQFCLACIMMLRIQLSVYIAEMLTLWFMHLSDYMIALKTLLSLNIAFIALVV